MITLAASFQLASASRTSRPAVLHEIASFASQPAEAAEETAIVDQLFS